jgi:hypothetical protein
LKAAVYRDWEMRRRWRDDNAAGQLGGRRRKEHVNWRGTALTG